MDTSTYLNLLSSLVVQLRAIGDLKGGQLVGRWMLTLESDSPDAQSKQKLSEHFQQVRKSALAISILAIEKYSPDKFATKTLEDTVKKLTTEIDNLSTQLIRIRKIVDDPGIVSLVGEFLSSVTFVMDYVQLDFCGATITSFVYPMVEENSQRFVPMERGYRDALCGRIGIKVSQVFITEHKTIALDFEDDSKILFPLTDKDNPGPEHLNYQSSTGVLWVW